MRILAWAAIIGAGIIGVAVFVCKVTGFAELPNVLLLRAGIVLPLVVLWGLWQLKQRGDAHGDGN